MALGEFDIVCANCKRRRGNHQTTNDGITHCFENPFRNYGSMKRFEFKIVNGKFSEFKPTNIKRDERCQERNFKI